jgi:hypothetical protein
MKADNESGVLTFASYSSASGQSRQTALSRNITIRTYRAAGKRSPSLAWPTV